MSLIQVANLIVMAVIVHIIGTVLDSVTVIKWTSFVCVRLLVWGAIALLIIEIA